MAEVYEEECLGSSLRDDLLTPTSLHSYRMSKLFETLEGWRVVCGLAYNLREIKGNFIFSYLCNFASLLLSLLSWPDVR